MAFALKKFARSLILFAMVNSFFLENDFDPILFLNSCHVVVFWDFHDRFKNQIISGVLASLIQKFPRVFKVFDENF